MAANRIIRTIDLLLNASELQIGSYEPKFDEINIDKEILSKLFQSHRARSNQNGVEFIYRCEIDKPKIIADDYSLTQIFTNLIDNAIKYTKKGKIEIILKKNKNDNIEVEINDTGVGIGKEFISHLFDAFAQEEQGYTRSFEGNGLGLWLVKKYCTINNAKIEVSSEKNVGTKFKITFDKELNIY